MDNDLCKSRVPSALDIWF